MAQLIRPNATATSTGISITPSGTAHEAIDEVTSSTTDFIYAAGGTGSARFNFGSPAANTTTSGTNDCTIRWTGVRLANGTSTLSTSGSGSPTVTITLYENGSAISAVTKVTTMATGSSTFSDSLVFSSSAITNWDNVEVLVELADNGGGPNNRDAGLAWLEIETPNAVVVTPKNFTFVGQVAGFAAASDAEQSVTFID